MLVLWCYLKIEMMYVKSMADSLTPNEGSVFYFTIHLQMFSASEAVEMA